MAGPAPPSLSDPGFPEAATNCRRSHSPPAGKAGPLPPLPPGALVASLGGGTVGAPPPLNLYATFPRRVAATRMIDEQNHTYHMTHV